MIEFKNNFSLFLLQILIVHAVNSFAYTPCEDCTHRANVSELSKIQLRLYPSDDIDDHLNVLIEDAAQLYNYIDNDKPTVIYISGWTESPDSDSVVSIVGAYMERRDHNILLVDYKEIAAGEWIYVLLSANGVGYTLAKAFDKLVAAGLDSKKIHVVGHSLGGQVSGYIGRYASFSIPRITGLDPAGGGFNFLVPRLNRGDAQFVDIIYTDAGIYGVYRKSGDANFYPNGGSRLQPGCPRFYIPFSEADFCSHYKSWQFYAESLINEKAFLSVKCDSKSEFESNNCKDNEKVEMGFATPFGTEGSFYLTTNDKLPYGKGDDGVNPDS